MYSSILREHASNPRNRRAFPEANAAGTSRFHECGDVFQLFLRVEGERIQEARFQAQACGPAIGVGSFCTELLRGMTVDEARQLNAFQLDERLGGLPPQKRHAYLLLLDSLHQALHSIASNTGSLKGVI